MTLIIEEKPYDLSTKHDATIMNLEDRLKRSMIKYDFIKHNIVCRTQSKTILECDLWARYISPVTWKVYDLFFEIKRGDRNLYKGVIQLKKDKLYLSKNQADVVHKFFVNQNKILKIRY